MHRPRGAPARLTGRHPWPAYADRVSTTPSRGTPQPRGRNAWRGALLLLLLVVLVGVAWAYLGPGREPGTGPASESPSPSPTPSIPEIARQQVWTSDTQASGEYATSTVVLASGTNNARTVDYVVKVETTVPDVVPDEVAREIQKTFDDPRGWSGYGKTSFRAVAEPTDDTLVIYIASPDTTQKLCAPADVERKWNCRNGNSVVLNSDRWLYMTPTYDDLGTYRSYLVNHEVGHFLGLNHVDCPGKGDKAPVMMQQSVDLGGCVPNAWPKEAD